MSDELKPCPFCIDVSKGPCIVPVPSSFTPGADVEAYYVACVDCGVEQSASFDTETEAIEAWNRRAPSVVSGRSE